MQYMMEEYKMLSPPIRTEETTGSLPDSGHGTTSVASTGRSQMSLKEKIAEIGKSLQVCKLKLFDLCLTCCEKGTDYIP